VNKKIVLVCKSVWYYSMFDEELFFLWIKKIQSIVSYEGKKDELFLYCSDKIIDDGDLRELLALFYRYKIDMKQLIIFLNDDNRHWFCENKKSYWYKRVFN
jgi:hypothetical protein